MKKGVITLLDILGWKGVWQRNPNAIESLIEIINMAKSLSLELFERESFGDKKSKNIFKGMETSVVSISDTIAVVSYGDTNKLINCHAILSAFIISKSIEVGLPVRGAICCGDLHTKDNIFAGPAVDEVASWYETVDWIGVMLTPSALLEYIPVSDVTDKILIEYTVIVKNTGPYNTKCVNWHRAWKIQDQKGEAELKKQFSKLGPITPDISNKLMNTLMFFNKVENN